MLETNPVSQFVQIKLAGFFLSWCFYINFEWPEPDLSVYPNLFQW